MQPPVTTTPLLSPMSPSTLNNCMVYQHRLSFSGTQMAAIRVLKYLENTGRFYGFEYDCLYHLFFMCMRSGKYDFINELRMNFNSNAQTNIGMHIALTISPVLHLYCTIIAPPMLHQQYLYNIYTYVNNVTQISDICFLGLQNFEDNSVDIRTPTWTRHSRRMGPRLSVMFHFNLCSILDSLFIVHACTTIRHALVFRVTTRWPPVEHRVARAGVARTSVARASVTQTSVTRFRVTRAYVTRTSVTQIPARWRAFIHCRQSFSWIVQIRRGQRRRYNPVCRFLFKMTDQGASGGRGARWRHAQWPLLIDFRLENFGVFHFKIDEGIRQIVVVELVAVRSPAIHASGPAPRRINISQPRWSWRQRRIPRIQSSADLVTSRVTSFERLIGEYPSDYPSRSSEDAVFRWALNWTRANLTRR